MKQYVLGGPLGKLALALKAKLEIMHAAHFRPEFVGTEANNLLSTEIITRICEPNKTFIDVGAHIGSVIAAVRNTHSSIKILAIEAIPAKVKNLRRRYPFAEVYECAVGETVGEVSFFVDTARSGYSSLGKPINPGDQSKVEIMVKIDKLDNLIAASDVDAIKIDVEGAELGVLRGGIGVLQRCRPIVMFESGPQSDDGLGYTKEAMWDFLSENEFAIVVPNRVAHNDSGLTRDGFVESHLYPPRTTNYFAIPLERRIEIRNKARRILRVAVSS
jgi:FkbM family methyltransferase